MHGFDDSSSALRRMAERVAHLVDCVLPRVPIRQWFLSLPHPLRYRLAWDHTLCRAVVRRLMRAILGFLRRRGARDEVGSRPRAVSCAARWLRPPCRRVCAPINEIGTSDSPAAPCGLLSPKSGSSGPPPARSGSSSGVRGATGRPTCFSIQSSCWSGSPRLSRGRASTSSCTTACWRHGPPAGHKSSSMDGQRTPRRRLTPKPRAAPTGRPVPGVRTICGRN